MAELTAPAATGEQSAASGCCAPAVQETCCQPSEKSACCDTSATGGACGCADGARAIDPPHDAEGALPMAELTKTDIREQVRERYAGHAKLAIDVSPGAAREAEEVCCGTTGQSSQWGDVLYDAESREGATEGAVAASLGCGVPTAVADLHEGETVLDLGSGAGADVLIAARRVGAAGRAIGLDMTDEMLELARRNAAAAGATNVEFLKGYIEELPLPDASVDVVISNCVINLSADKHQVIREAARVLRPGGRFAVSDVIADPDMDAATRKDMEQWTGCIAGALTRVEFAVALHDAGLDDVEITETHRVHEHAGAAIIRARKPD
jgi:arsenite methyltransferase